MRHSANTERPLTPRARLALQASAAATILAFYAAATFTMAILAILLVIGIVVVAGAARVGLSRYVANIFKPVMELLGIFARRLWLRRETAYRIALSQAEASLLFSAVGKLAERLEVTPPETIVLEMHTGAWVRLKGFRRATGNVTLGVGYDLLAGLSVRETEAVLAHELGHMRFVQRGLTADNGTEFHQYRPIEHATRSRFYFAPPYQAWTRGTCENTNGLVRQYLPRGRDLAGLTHADGIAIARQLNQRPRKRHRYRTPEEYYDRKV